MESAGDIIAVTHVYLRSGGEEEVVAEVTKIRERVERLIDVVKASDEPPARVALTWARAAAAGRGSLP